MVKTVTTRELEAIEKKGFPTGKPFFKIGNQTVFLNPLRRLRAEPAGMESASGGSDSNNEYSLYKDVKRKAAFN